MRKNLKGRKANGTVHSREKKKTNRGRDCTLCFCLENVALCIEKYCMRRLLTKWKRWYRKLEIALDVGTKDYLEIPDLCGTQTVVRVLPFTCDLVSSCIIYALQLVLSIWN